MSAGATLKGRAPWLEEPQLQKLLAALGSGGEEARVVGGAVRNALLGMPVTDIDVATTTVPDETMARGRAAGFKVVPTGVEHGTVTLVAGGRGYEVTTLRADVETDGRRARVRFGRDWARDAARRDFTINGLYARADGTVVDLVGGLADLQSGTVRFIGEAELRIREDFLRILRFFRFFAWYGRGRPDADGLKACARLKPGIDKLSAERKWTEMRKLLSAPDPSRAILWMRQAGVLGQVLPETEKWGIDALHGLIAAERRLSWEPDALLRLEAIVPPDQGRLAALAQRLRLSNADAARIREWASAAPVAAATGEQALSARLYREPGQGIRDRLRLSLAGALAGEDHAAAELLESLLAFAESWQRPVFPVKGADLKAIGFSAGVEFGRVLKALEESWIASGFRLGRAELLHRAAEMKSGT